MDNPEGIAASKARLRVVPPICWTGSPGLFM